MKRNYFYSFDYIFFELLKLEVKEKVALRRMEAFEKQIKNSCYIRIQFRRNCEFLFKC